MEPLAGRARAVMTVWERDETGFVLYKDRVERCFFLQTNDLAAN